MKLKVFEVAVILLSSGKAKTFTPFLIYFSFDDHDKFFKVFYCYTFTKKMVLLLELLPLVYQKQVVNEELRRSKFSMPVCVI